MSRYFALPVGILVLALVGLRMRSAPAAAEEAPPILVSLPATEPEPAAPAPKLIVPPQEIWEAPKPEPLIIVLEPLPVAAPAEVIERTVIVPQTTIVHAPTTNIYYPVVEPAPEPRKEVTETPVLVVVCAAHRRAGCCIALPPPRRSAVQQDAFFKSIPFMPATPRGPRYNP